MFLVCYDVQTLLGTIPKQEEFKTMGEVQKRIQELGSRGYSCKLFKEIKVKFSMEVVIDETDQDRNVEGLGKDKEPTV
ncbi:MAG: hypothetical protein M0P69_11760 [Bacteroidales bacterium]|nr:hypothetical protein [Bacteroidales bacterium]